jgi:hypothetical protein
MRVGGQRHASAALPLGKRLVTHCLGGWVDPRAHPAVFDVRTLLGNLQ